MAALTAVVGDDRLFQLYEENNDDTFVYDVLIAEYGPMRGLSLRSLRRWRAANDLQFQAFSFLRQNVSADDMYRMIVDDMMDDASISQHLVMQHGPIPGLSPRTVRRYRQQLELVIRPLHQQEDIQRYVLAAVNQVSQDAGATYLQGTIRSMFQVDVPIRTITRILSIHYPERVVARRLENRVRIPRRRIFTEYFGEQLCCDQNEKLQEYSVYFFCGVDTHSRKIVYISAYPRKSALVVYSAYYEAILHYGHFHRIQIDAGTENVLLEWSQNRIQHLFPVHRPNPVPVNIVSSVNNTRVERLWQFTNMFIAAPLRRTLDEFRRRFGFAVGMADRVRVFCVADATCRIARHMLNTWMNTQNSHTICSLKATPIEIQQATCATTPIQPGSLPTPADAYQAYQAEGGQLQVDQVVGFDPLDGHPALHGYREQFLQQWPIADIVADIHSNYESFSPIFMHFLIAHETITKQLQQRL